MIICLVKLSPSGVDLYLAVLSRADPTEILLTLNYIPKSFLKLFIML